MSIVSLPEDLINKILMMREHHPVAILFSRWYPVYLAKKYMKKSLDILNKNKKKYNSISNEIKCKSVKIFNFCFSNIECTRLIMSHLNICEFGCTLNYLSEVCEFRDTNGRCSHYYKLKQNEDEIEQYNNIVNRFNCVYESDKLEYEWAVSQATDKECEFNGI